MNKAEKAARKAEARADYQSGMSYRQLAAKYGVTIGAITKWAKADGWDTGQGIVRAAMKRAESKQQKVYAEEESKRESKRQENEELAEEFVEAVVAKAPEEEPVDYYVLRESAMLALERINQRLRSEKPLEPRDIKSITSALLDLKNQLNALSPRELREMALRLRSLEKQTDAAPAEPVVIQFVDMEGADA